MMREHTVCKNVNQKVHRLKQRPIIFQEYLLQYFILITMYINIFIKDNIIIYQ